MPILMANVGRVNVSILIYNTTESFLSLLSNHITHSQYAISFTSTCYGAIQRVLSQTDNKALTEQERSGNVYSWSSSESSVQREKEINIDFLEDRFLEIVKPKNILLNLH